MKDKIISILFVIILFSFMLLGIFIKDREYSEYERRKLTTTEDLQADGLSVLDDYLTSQAPFRDELISLNSLVNRYILLNKEYNGVYIKDGYLIEKNYPLDYKSLDGFINKINYINNKYLSKSNVYYSIIPDKAYFIDDSKYLKIDYNKVFSELKDKININYIDIESYFELRDYYKSDIHIKEKNYFKILNELDKYLNFGYKNIEYKNEVFNNFYGSSFSKAPFINKENLEYLTSRFQDNVEVEHLEYGRKELYDLDKLNGIDAYNVFLSGPSGLININNKNIDNNKELIIFRDSFSSSLSILLVPFYSNITLIDLRYINMDIVKDYVDFKDKDVLFIYSTLIVNNSNILKVNEK